MFFWLLFLLGMSNMFSTLKEVMTRLPIYQIKSSHPERCSSSDDLVTTGMVVASINDDHAGILHFFFVWNPGLYPFFAFNELNFSTRVK